MRDTIDDPMLGLTRGPMRGAAARCATHLLALLRLVSLLVLASFGTVLLVRCAPGYFTRAGEMDAEHSGVARGAVAAQQAAEGGTAAYAMHMSQRAFHGDFGLSNQYGLPVGALLVPRLRVTARVLLPTVLLAPLLGLLCALPCSRLRAPGLERAVATATLLGIAVPVSVLASASLLSGKGGPAAVLLAVIAARDFRFFTRLLRRQFQATHVLHAQAYGAGPLRALLFGVLLPVRRDLLNLVALSFLTALGGMVPVEVIFGLPGVGQLAWNAAMNRDLPVLLAVTLVMAVAIGVAGAVLNGKGPQGSGVAA